MEHAPLSWVRSAKWTFILIGAALALSLAVSAGVYVVHDAKSDRNARDQKLSAESTNRLVCVTRPYVLDAIDGAIFTIDKNKNPVTVEAARKALNRNRIFLRGLITVPPTFNCLPLIAQIAREAARAAKDAEHG